MNFKTMFGIGLVGFGLAFAQDGSFDSTPAAQSMSEQQLQQQEEQAAASESLTAPVPFVAPEIPKESKRSSFNAILHGKSYNRNSNMAAANNTDLLLKYPNLFANRKFFYIEPTNKLGIVSLGSFFTAFDISKAPYDDTQLGRLTLGYAVPGFGFYIRAGLGRERVSNDAGVVSKTYGGDDWAAAIAKSFLGMNVAADVDWLTTKTQTHADPDLGAETEDRFDSLTINLSLTNAPTAKNFTWTLGARFVSFNNETEVDGEVQKPGDPASYWDIAPYIRGGLSVLENENARVLIGAAAIVSYRNYDDPLELYTLTAVLQPSMLGEVFVGEEKNLMFYGEVGYDWVAFQYMKNTDTDTNRMMDVMDAVNASIGFRYQYKDFLAVEMGLGQKLFTGIGNFFQADGTFIDFSAMVRF
ncbi:hypothetical protein [Fibrobacter sp. UWB11]|uniref:hypothetical protein n=1 Tax=Fibrobacter sp. UWB11 TaxID=1896202 RepID=UPI000927BE03|nr:hypothetical protein [Fibrobacter sp. UWB11]SIO02847.1 hypothetical protein SAMN05720758_1081 [Fibrobacter sp. UWB11]